jgi:hypothetical protein
MTRSLQRKFGSVHDSDVVHRPRVRSDREPVLVVDRRLLIAGDQRGRLAGGDGEPLDRDGRLDQGCADLAAQPTEPRPGRAGPLAQPPAQLVELAQLRSEGTCRLRCRVQHSMRLTSDRLVVNSMNRSVAGYWDPTIPRSISSPGHPRHSRMLRATKRAGGERPADGQALARSSNEGAPKWSARECSHRTICGRPPEPATRPASPDRDRQDVLS